jgi:hypothetical protein
MHHHVFTEQDGVGWGKNAGSIKIASDENSADINGAAQIASHMAYISLYQSDTATLMDVAGDDVSTISTAIRGFTDLKCIYATSFEHSTCRADGLPYYVLVNRCATTQTLSLDTSSASEESDVIARKTTYLNTDVGAWSGLEDAVKPDGSYNHPWLDGSGPITPSLSYTSLARAPSMSLSLEPHSLSVVEFEQPRFATDEAATASSCPDLVYFSEWADRGPREMCQDEHADVDLGAKTNGDPATWDYYTFSCRVNMNGVCYSDASFCDTASGANVWDENACGNAALGTSCGCCSAVTASPTVAPTSQPTAAPTSTPKTTYYVDAAAGNDSNDGLSEEAAFKTLRQAAQVIGDYSTVYVKDGTYTNNNFGSGGLNNGAVMSLSDINHVEVRRARASEKRLLRASAPLPPHPFSSFAQLFAFPGHSPKIEFDGSGAISCNRVSFFEVSGFEIEGPNAGITKEEADADRVWATQNPESNKNKKFSGRGIVVWEGNNIYIHHNTVHHCPNSGIRTNKADYVRIEHNIVHSNTCACERSERR